MHDANACRRWASSYAGLAAAGLACAACVACALAFAHSVQPLVLQPENWPEALPGAEGGGTSWVNKCLSTLSLHFGQTRLCCRGQEAPRMHLADKIAMADCGNAP